MDLKKPAILSISLLTVMTNAAVTPLLGLISKSFPTAGITLIKQVVTIPSLMIIIFSIISGQLVRYLPKKVVLAIGLIIYLLGGFGSRWATSITSLLILRAFNGAGAGLVIPLASSFITDFYSGNERTEMVGYSTFVSFIGAAISPLATGWFGTEDWRDAFFIFLLALAILIFTLWFIPSKKKQVHNQEIRIKHNTPYKVIVLAVLGCGIYTIFYLMPTDISFFVETTQNTKTSLAAILMAIEIIAAAFAGILFSKFTHKLGLFTYTFGFSFMTIGFMLMIFSSAPFWLILCVIMIGMGIGTLRPVIYDHTARICPPEETTTAFAFVNSGFSLGQFLSPFFYYGITSLFSIEIVTGNYLVAAIILSVASILSVVSILRKRKTRQCA